MTENERRKGSLIIHGALALLAGLAMIGCQELNTPLYFKGPVIEAQGGEDPPVTTGLSLRFRDPTQKERDALRMEADALGLGMDIPWVSREKVHIELLYKITNRSDQDGTFNVLVDGATEYTKYDYLIVSDAIAMGDPDEAVFFPLMQSMPKMLAAGQSYSGLLREDDFDEGALDIDALGRWIDGNPMSPTFAGVLINDSDVNNVGLGLMPGYALVPDPTDPTMTRMVLKLVNPGLRAKFMPMFVELNVILQTDTAMTCEYVVRVRDDDDRLLHNDSDTLYETSPTLFQPAVMP
jgi:hypothetical protein